MQLNSENLLDYTRGINQQLDNIERYIRIFQQHPQIKNGDTDRMINILLSNTQELLVNTNDVINTAIQEDFNVDLSPTLEEFVTHTFNVDELDQSFEDDAND